MNKYRSKILEIKVGISVKFAYTYLPTMSFTELVKTPLIPKASVRAGEKIKILQITLLLAGEENII